MARKKTDGGRPPDPPTAEAHLGRVEEAVRVAAARLRNEPGYAGSALAGAEVLPGVPELDIGLVAVVLPEPPGRGRLWVSYTQSWLAASSDAAIADELVAEVRRAAAEAGA